ncbi:histidine phosphatase family protein [Mycolicibacterium poriferae]|jgi:phosphohistidine phosphatase|uniref:Phosphohistidine phosphatase n=1 Tax=Mycolicibacterium poriferae TaxID=39694 RepID=A0A6N4VG99_9MYCO|nr:histidine phosphatase family protein [Mycolicibacterium poriferae]MCV7264754.1 histidine phosphatase family protein [Mycolicibacterium poriferae]BBX53479.1 phosphohistidine phosphatase [Mycolicibacterium poriferae]
MSDRYRTLLLLRHAKSDYPSGVADHDRPLADRGIREAALVGDWIRTSVSPVDAVLCSTATRTRQTLERTGIDAPVHYVDRIYEATPGIIIDEINGVAARFGDATGDPSTLLVVGHEPVMSGLALGLADEATSRGATAEAILEKFPTSAVAVLRTNRPWAELELRGAELVDFYIAR